MATDPWQIPDPDADWDCGWEGATRFRLRLFRALSLADKIRAVEEMCRVAALLQRRKRSGGMPEG